jgi:hypothetical protein
VNKWKLSVHRERDHVGMPPARKRGTSLAPAGLAGRALERWAAALLGIQVARSLYGRWRRMSAVERAPLERAPADERWADAMLDEEEAEPEISTIEVQDLRADLTRELERLAGAQIRASRGPGHLAGGAPSADGQA